MKKSLKVVLFLCLIALSLTVLPVSAQDAKYYRTYFSSGDIPSIDTALVGDQIGIQLADELTVGLLRQNEETGNIVNGMAKSYEISEDGTVFTFKLIENVPWVRYNAETGAVEEVLDCDGNVRYVTANDFYYGAERTLRPSTASDYAFIAAEIAGGDAYLNSEEGTVDFSTVGVKVIDDYTIEYTFSEPGVFNLNILSMWMLHAMPSWIIDGDACTEGVAERWTESEYYQGYGPFTLQEWVHDSHLTVIANPFWPGTDEVPTATIAGVDIRIIDQSAGLSEYEADNMDSAGISAADYDRIMSDPALADEIFTGAADIGTEFLIFNHNLEPTNDVRIRKALSLSIDRDAVVTTLKTGIPATMFVNPAVSGAPDLGEGESVTAYDPEAAKALIDEYCAEKGIEPAAISMTLAYNTSESRKMFVELLQYMWSETLGIDVQLKNSEWKVFKVERNEGLDNIYRSSWVQDYMDANNFTKDVFLCNASYQSVTDWPSTDCTDVSNPAYQEYEKVLLEAAVETDPAKRGELYLRADEILINEEAIVSPVYWYSSNFLRKPNVKAPISLTGYDHWEKWTIE